MDLIKKLTGKNPVEYEPIAKSLIDNSDTELFAKLVQQDEFLFDFVKTNVARRLRMACNKDNYQNLINFLEYYSPSYDSVFADALYQYGGIELLPVMKEMFLNGNNNKKAYIAKFFSLVDKNYLQELLPLLRSYAYSEFEPLALNSIEVLSKINDEISKNEAIAKLDSEDEFEQYSAVKFLAAYQAKDVLPQILSVMKKSSLSENIAFEVPYLISIDELLEQDFDAAILVLSHIVNAIPEIIPPSVTVDYNLFGIFENLYINKLTSASAVLLRLAQEKFAELTSSEEYLYDCDKNTKEEVYAVNQLLVGINGLKLKNLLYDELYEESDFVFFAIDFADNIEELETLLDGKNQTLILKVLTILKEKQALKDSHKELALKNITNFDIKQVVEAL